MIRLSALLLLITCLAPRSLSAQDLNPVTLEFLVNQTTSLQQTFPSVASDEDGGYVIAWSNWNLSGNNCSMRLRRYGPDHQPLTDEIQIATGLGTANRPYVHYWKEGRYVIVWTTGPLPGGSSMRVLNADNSLENIHVMDVPHDHHMHVRGDEMVAAYTSNQHIRLRKWDLLNNVWMGAAVQASETPNANYQMPQVRWTSTGGVVTVYRGNALSPHSLYRKTFNANLLAQTPESNIYTQSGSLSGINVSINAQDQLLIYARYAVGGLDSKRSWVLDAQGAILTEGLGNIGAYNAYSYTACELFDNGNVVLTNNYKNSLNDPLDYCVRGRYAMFLGAPSTDWEILTTTTSGPQRYQRTTKLPNAGYIVVWNGNGFQGDDNGVYARAFAASDFPTAAPEREGLAFEAFPNPFRDRLVVSMEKPGPMQVFDATGRMVHTERLVAGPNALPLDQLSPGTYLLVWHAVNGTRLTHRVVKE